MRRGPLGESRQGVHRFAAAGWRCAHDAASARTSTAKLGPRKAPKRVEQPAKTARKASRLELEQTDARAAIGAYEKAVGEDAENVSAWINWGRLLHERGRTAEAESVYRRALKECGSHPLLMYNLGVLLEDLGRTGPALDAYMTAVREDPKLADCHYNLARLYESLGKQQKAIRHLGQYRRLVTSGEAH